MTPDQPERVAPCASLGRRAGHGSHSASGGSDHPWTGVRFTATWGSRELLDPILVVPELVAEVSADTAIERGAWRHPLRFVRLRLDVTVADVPSFGEGVQPSSG
ncbi:hypothetical protein BGM19_38945 [Streptomyces agglomeratus]|uniref:hypothetical protein n=1 Tax=Streptomyces agglomeratus TaxID=285458 RepID=UPI00086DF032|nr:hypothetical protein [Streptomyces agglomeratus]OEJ56615.1 hypothetical protein BGM19_38945 [Streptomyces agglomeratus]